MKNLILTLVAVIFTMSTIFSQSKVKVLSKINAQTFPTVKWNKVNSVESHDNDVMTLVYENGENKIITSLLSPLATMTEEEALDALNRVYDVAKTMTANNLTDLGLAPDYEDQLGEVIASFDPDFYDVNKYLDILRSDKIVIEMYDPHLEGFLGSAQDFFEMGAVFFDIVGYGNPGGDCVSVWTSTNKDVVLVEVNSGNGDFSSHSYEKDTKTGKMNKYGGESSSGGFWEKLADLFGFGNDTTEDPNNQTTNPCDFWIPWWTENVSATTSPVTIYSIGASQPMIEYVAGNISLVTLNAQLESRGVPKILSIRVD